MNSLIIIRRVLSFLKKIPVIGFVAGMWWDKLFGDVFFHYGCPNSKRTAKLQLSRRINK